MNNYYIALQGIFYTVFIEFFFDSLILRLNIKSNARYFFLHFIFNFFITIITLKDALLCLYNPLNNFDSPFIYSGILSTGCISGFHIYHMLFFKIKNLEEWIHHIISCILVPFIGLNIPYGCALSLANLSMCGIPGGIDYFLLFLLKYNIIDKFTEKKINRLLNLVLRYPFMFISCYIFYINYFRDNTLFTNIYLQLFSFIGMFLHLFNAGFYCDKVIENYYSYKLK
jgi:hypothetical protein